MGMVTFQLRAQQIVEADTLTPVLISATKIETKIFDVGRTVAVISNRQMDQNNFSIGQLLNQVPGMFCFGTSLNPGMNETVFSRFSGSEHTIASIDGMPVTDPSSVNGVADFSEFTLDDVKQIEVVEGSQSTLFGSGASGGLINFISENNFHDGLNATLNVGGGTFGKKTFSFQTHGSIVYQWKNGFYFGGSASQVHSNGLDATVDTITNPVTFKSFDNDNYDSNNFKVQTGYHSKKFTGNIFCKLTNRLTDFDKQSFKYNNAYGPNPLAYYDGDYNVIQFNRIIAATSLQYQLSETASVKIDAGVSSMIRQVKSDSSIIDALGTTDATSSFDRYNGVNKNLSVEFSLTKGKYSLLAATGVTKDQMQSQNDFYSRSAFGVYEIHNNTDSLNIHQLSSYAFIQFNVKGEILSPALSKLELTIGSRFTQHSIFKHNLSFDINPSFHFAKHNLLFAVFSNGYSAPSLYQLFAPDSYYTSGITRGNATLKPEQIFQIEGGVKIHSGKLLNITVSAYHSHILNDIEYVYLWNPDVAIDSLGTNFLRDDYRGDTYINAGESKINGGSFSIEVPLTQKLKLSASCSAGKGKLFFHANNGSDYTGNNQIQFLSNGAFASAGESENELTRRPATAFVSADFQITKQFNFSIDGHYTGSFFESYYNENILPFGALSNFTVPSKVVADASVCFHHSDKFIVALSCFNLLNNHNTESIGFTSIGRSSFIKFTYRY